MYVLPLACRHRGRTECSSAARNSRRNLALLGRTKLTHSSRFFRQPHHVTPTGDFHVLLRALKRYTTGVPRQRTLQPASTSTHLHPDPHTAASPANEPPNQPNNTDTSASPSCPPQVLIIDQILRRLEFLHSLGLIHRAARRSQVESGGRCWRLASYVLPAPMPQA